MHKNAPKAVRYSSQTASESTAESVFSRYLSFGSLVEGGRVVPNWLTDGSCFWYCKGGPNEREIIKVNPIANTAVPFFDVLKLRSVLKDSLGHEPAGRGVPFESLQVLSANRVAFTLEDTRFELDLEHYALSRPAPPSDYSYAHLVHSEAERGAVGTFEHWKFYATGRKERSPEATSPDRQWHLTVIEGNLALRASVDGHTVQLTDDGNETAFWDFDPGLWNPWSPNAVHFAVLKQDTEGMTRTPTIEWLKPQEQLSEVISLPAGGALNRSELYLFDVFKRRPIQVELGDTTGPYLRVLAWKPDGSELIVARYSRLLNRVELQAVNARTGRVRSVLTEESPTFLAHHHQVLWGNETGFFLLPDGSGFIWSSERTGWNHLYHYDLEGQLVAQVTQGSWRVKAVVHADLATGWVYFTGHGDKTRPYDTHLYRARLDGQNLEQLTEGQGQHTIALAPAGKCFIDTYSSVDCPPLTVLRLSDGTLLRTLEKADVSKLLEIGWTAPKECVVKAADGVTDLWATLYLPYNYSPTKSYPVVEYIYGGPQSVARPLDFGDRPRIPAFERGENFNRALANLGFVVVTLDARGTPQRSKAFQDVVFRRFGDFEIADHAAALRQIAQQYPCMDLDRVGVWGWSWGGQFAFRALTQAPDLYKSGICGWPAVDLGRMMLYEIYLGLPQENPAAYRNADVFTLASQLQGELLLVGGMNDPSTQADFFKLSETLIRLGRQHRAMSYPNCGHGAVGKTAEFNMELMKRFLVEQLMNRTPKRVNNLVLREDRKVEPCAP